MLAEYFYKDRLEEYVDSLVDLWIIWAILCSVRSLTTYIFAELDFWTCPVQNRTFVSQSCVLTRLRCDQALFSSTVTQRSFKIYYWVQTSNRWSMLKGKVTLLLSPESLQTDSENICKVSSPQEKKNLSIVADYINH